MVKMVITRTSAGDYPFRDAGLFKIEFLTVERRGFSSQMLDLAPSVQMNDPFGVKSDAAATAPAGHGNYEFLR